MLSIGVLCLFLFLASVRLEFATHAVEVEKSALATLAAEQHSKHVLRQGTALRIDYPPACPPGDGIYCDKGNIHFRFRFAKDRSFQQADLEAALRRDLTAKLTADYLRAEAQLATQQPEEFIKSAEFGRLLLKELGEMHSINEQKAALLDSPSAEVQVSLVELQMRMAEHFAFSGGALQTGKGLRLSAKDFPATDKVTPVESCFLLAEIGHSLQAACNRAFSAAQKLGGNGRDNFLKCLFFPAGLSISAVLKTDVKTLVEHVNSTVYLAQPSKSDKNTLAHSAVNSYVFEMKVRDIPSFFLTALRTKIPKIAGKSDELVLVDYLKFVVEGEGVAGASAGACMATLFTLAQDEGRIKAALESMLMHQVDVEMGQERLETLVLDCVFDSGAFDHRIEDGLVRIYEPSVAQSFPGAGAIVISGLLHDKSLAGASRQLAAYVAYAVRETLQRYTDKSLKLDSANSAFDVVQMFKSVALMKAFNKEVTQRHKIDVATMKWAPCAITQKADARDNANWKAPDKTDAYVPQSTRYFWLWACITGMIGIMLAGLFYFYRSELLSLVVHSRRERPAVAVPKEANFPILNV